MQNHFDSQSETWRLIISPPKNGSWNMAVDEALLESIGNRNSLPALRLYAWSPPCLSLGHAQPISDVDKDKLDSKGWEIVRRITGGRAILHTDELTYSVIGPQCDPLFAGGVLESYLRLSRALLNAVNRLGIQAQALEKNRDINVDQQKNDPICFEVPSNYEITVHGKKLIGSAQGRKKMGILQHGTLPLYGDLARIIDVLHGLFEKTDERGSRQKLLDRATTIERIVGKRIPWEDVARIFILAFEETLNLSFVESELTPDELERTSTLIDEKYSSPDWTDRI